MSTPTLCLRCGIQCDYPARRGDRIAERACRCGGQLVRAGRNPSRRAREFLIYFGLEIYPVAATGAPPFETAVRLGFSEGDGCDVSEWPCSATAFEAQCPATASKAFRGAVHELIKRIDRRLAEEHCPALTTRTPESP
jgi:hypothetical protein